MTKEIINPSKIVDEIYTPFQKPEELEIELNWYYTDAEIDLKNRIWRMSSPTISIDIMTPRQLFWYHMCLTNGRILRIPFRNEWIKIFKEKLENLKQQQYE